MKELYAHLRLIQESSTESFSEDILLKEEVTYYNLRQFITLLFRNTSNSEMKKLMLELLKILAKLEVMNKPVPTIKKLKEVSPLVFP